MVARILPEEARPFPRSNLEKIVDLKQLVTLTFDKNVGTADRVFRLLSGAVLAAAGWYFELPTAAAIPMSVLGAMWLLTGVLSKCSIYYALGYSTCPVSGEAFPRRSR